ncbi:MAG TPA: amidohydrolase [Actinomycetes bacterium]|nr:amidohydrolase [Actinomycetes bacterium]
MTNLNRRQFIGAAAAAGAGATAAAIPAFAQPASAGGKAATIIKNAVVFVGDNANTIGEAVAIGTDGRILAVGSNRRIKSYAGYSTEVIDAGGGTVMSGIHDGHVHPMYGGLRALNPSLEDAELTAAEVQALVTTFLADPTFGSEPDSWLSVEGWNPAGTPSDTLPHKDILDALSTARPIALSGSDGHNLWVNSKALQIAGIDSTTSDPAGGEIVRDGGGNPTGVLKDAAQDLVRQHIPGPTPEEMYDSFVGAWQQMAAGGITTILDAWVDAWQLDFYAALAENGHLLTRTFPALRAGTKKVSHPRNFLEKINALAGAYGEVPNLHFGTVKVFMDGVIEYPAQTAALLKPYLDADGNPTDNYGDLYVDGPTMGEFVRVLDKAGWQVHAHAIGDGAVRAALDGYEISRAANGNTDRRHTIAHLQLVHPDDYPRFAALNVIPDLQLQWATRNVWTMEALKPFIGQKRWKRMYPANSLLTAGARLAGGSDWPVDPLYPWNQVQTAIDRMGLYGEDKPLGIHEGITRRQSLRMHTRGTAYQLHQENKTGTIEAGKFADLVMLDRDVTACPVSEIKDSVPQLTMVGGNVTFDLTTTAGKTARRALEAAASTTAATGRIKHDQLGGRHTGCPCTSAHK